MASDGKIVVISGGTKGIGRGIAYKFAEEGFTVATYSRNLADLNYLKQDLRDKFGVQCYIKQVDARKREDVESFASEVLDLSGTIEVLVNNAGTFEPGAVLDEAEGAITNMIETNLYSAYYLTRILGRQMRDQKAGHIFNICSTASITPYINGGSYCISKHALYGFSRVLREELKAHKVKVTSVLPGATYTSSWESSGLEEDRFMKTEDLANAVFSTYQMSPGTVVEELLMRPQLGDI